MSSVVSWDVRLCSTKWCHVIIITASSKQRITHSHFQAFELRHWVWITFNTIFRCDCTMYRIKSRWNWLLFISTIHSHVSSVTKQSSLSFDSKNVRFFLSRYIKLPGKGKSGEIQWGQWWYCSAYHVVVDDDVNLNFDCLSCDAADEWLALTSQSLERSTELAPSRECFVNGLRVSNFPSLFSFFNV